MKNKKLHILFIYILCISSLWQVSAQNVSSPEGSVRITPIELWEKDDMLHIRMDIELMSRTMNDCQSWTIIPELVNNEEERKQVLPFILINGKKKEQLYKRRLVAKDTLLLNHPPHIKEVVELSSIDTVTYMHAMPYESWMDNASLTICQILTSCAGKEQWFLLEGLGEVKTEAYIPYSPSLSVNYIEPERQSKLRQKEGEAYLDFAIGKSDIVPSYKRNPVELEKIDASIREVASDIDMQITELRIEGYASPDGPYRVNEQLADKRAQSLKIYLQKKYPVLQNQIVLHSVAEDWNTFKELVRESSLKEKEQILSIIDSDDDPDRKEKRLKSLSSWHLLYGDYFPRLRRVKYKLDYKIRDFTVEEAEKLLQKNPGHLNQNELFTLAKSLGIDSPRGHEIIQLTVLLFPDDPVAHINMAASALSQGQIETARKHLDRVNGDQRAANNWGVYYLLQGDTEKAETYLRQSQEPEEMKKNLKELEYIRKDQEKQHQRSLRGITQKGQREM